MNRDSHTLGVALISLGASALFSLCMMATASASEADPPMPAPLSAEELAREVDAAVAVTPQVIVQAPRPITMAPATSFDQSGTLGVVNVGLVNIRSGPGSEADTEYEIVITLKRGTELTILGKQNDWYSIAWPQGHPCFITLDSIDGNVPRVVDSQGVSVPIKASGANLYVRPWEKSTIVGTLEGGDIVTVIKRRGDFLRIAAPPAARAWISAKYVDLASNVTLSQATAPKPGVITQSKKKTKKIAPKKETTKIVAKPRRLIPDPEVLRQQEKERHARYLQSIEDELAAIRAETQSRKQSVDGQYSGFSGLPTTSVSERAVADPVTLLTEDDFTGWVEHIGYGVKRPAAYRLVKGGDIVFLLRSSAYNLEEYVNCRVAVNGQVELAPGHIANVLVVDKLDLLDTGPLFSPVQDTFIEGEAETIMPLQGGDTAVMALPTAQPLGEIIEITPAD